MKVMAGLVEADIGTNLSSTDICRLYGAGSNHGGLCHIGRLRRERFELGEAYRLERAAEGLKFDHPPRR